MLGEVVDVAGNETFSAAFWVISAPVALPGSFLSNAEAAAPKPTVNIKPLLPNFFEELLSSVCSDEFSLSICLTLLEHLVLDMTTKENSQKS